MLPLIFIISTIFWIVYYIFQGLHDTHVVKEVELLRNKLPGNDSHILEEKIISHEVNWKFWDSLEKAMTKIGIAILIYVVSDDYIFALLLLCLSIFIRWVVHDLTVALALRGNLKHIGPEFVWTDKILRWLSRFGINQYVIKLIPSIIIILGIIYHISG